MLRPATEKDAAVVEDLMRSEPGLWQEGWRDDVLNRALTASGGLAFVWEEGGKVVGFVCAHDLGFRGYVSELIVHRAERSRGIGRQLLRHVERELQARGCAVVIADVWREATGFYRRLGWSEPDVKLMRRRLDT